METVIIVGAGASAELNLPIGEELKEKIARIVDIRFERGIRQISGDHYVLEAVRKHCSNSARRDVNQFLHAGWHIREAMPLSISIDNFFDNHRENDEIRVLTKIAIAQAIAESEKKSPLFFDHSMDVSFTRFPLCWHMLFSRLLFERCPFNNIQERLSKIVFISFNYDRCIKQFLYHAIKHAYNVSDTESAKALESLTVLHPYGSLGNLEWESKEDAAPFGQVGSAGLLAASNRIKTFSENIDDKILLNLKEQSLIEADKVIFLGFAFHPINMEFLRQKKRGRLKKIYGTISGVSESDAIIIKNQISDMFAGEKLSKVELSGERCLGFFQSYWRSLGFS